MNLIFEIQCLLSYYHHAYNKYNERDKTQKKIPLVKSATINIYNCKVLCPVIGNA